MQGHCYGGRPDGLLAWGTPAVARASGQRDGVAAMVSSRRARLMIEAQARDVGQAHKLGGHLGYFESANVGVRSGLGVLLLLAGIFLPVYGIRSLAVPGGPLGLLAQAAMICAGVAAAAVGIALVATAGPRHSDLIFVYDGGVAQIIRGGAALCIIPWGRFGHVVKEYYCDEDGGSYVVKIRITGADGTVITADTGYGPELRQLERHIDEVVKAMRLRGAIEQCQSGVPVVFGRLSVSRDGIGWDGGARYAAWRDIRSIHVSPDSISLGTSARKRLQRIAVDGIPDWCVAVPLIQDLAAQLAIPQQGTVSARHPGVGRIRPRKPER